MGVLIPAGYSQASFHHRCNGATKDTIWTIGFKNLTITDPVAAAEAMRQNWSGAGTPYLATAMSNSWSFIGVSVITELESGPSVGQAFTTIVGTASFQPVPLNSSILVRKNTAAGGRKNRGRAFLPPTYFDETQVSALGVLLGSDVTTFQGKVDAAKTADVADGFSYYLLHSDGTLPTAVTSLSVQGTLATQRRRMR